MEAGAEDSVQTLEYFVEAMAIKKKKTAKKPQPKPKVKPKGKPKTPDVYKEATRMVELMAEQDTFSLLKSGKGVVPMEALAGIRLFTPVQVWRGFGIPTEPTQEVAVIVSYLVRRGMRPDGACRAVGITLPEYSRWTEQGIRDIQAGVDSPFSKFVRAVDMADAQDELADITRITDGRNGWDAAAWKRERKNKAWQKVGTVATQVNITAGVAEQNVETLIPGAAEVLYHLEQAGYLGLPAAAGATIEVKAEEEKK